MNFEEERERIKLHRKKALEIIGGKEFLIYKVANTRFFEKDLEPQCMAGYDFYMNGNAVHGIPPTNPKEIIKNYFSQGKYLTDLADRQAHLSYPDSPCISWTVDMTVAESFKNNDYFKEYGYLLLEAVGRLMPIPEIEEDLYNISYNDGFFIPALDRISHITRPEKEIEFQKEFVTFDVFPKEKYKVVEKYK